MPFGLKYLKISDRGASALVNDTGAAPLYSLYSMRMAFKKLNIYIIFQFFILYHLRRI